MGQAAGDSRAVRGTARQRQKAADRGSWGQADSRQSQASKAGRQAGPPGAHPPTLRYLRKLSSSGSSISSARPCPLRPRAVLRREQHRQTEGAAAVKVRLARFRGKMQGSRSGTERVCSRRKPGLSAACARALLRWLILEFGISSFGRAGKRQHQWPGSSRQMAKMHAVLLAASDRASVQPSETRVIGSRRVSAATVVDP